MRNNTKHRAAAASLGLVLAASLAACGGKSDDTGSTTNPAAEQDVQVMMFPGQSYRLPVVIAEQQGYLKKRGIKLKIVAQPNNLQGIQGLLATKSQVGQVSTPTLTQGVQAGSSAAFFCGGINVLQTTLFAKSGSSLRSTAEGASWQEVLKSLDGKKVGIQTPVGSGLQLIFAAALKEAGVTNVTYVNIGGGNDTTLAALNNGSVDVAQVNPTGTQHMVTQKAAKPLVYMPEGPEAYKYYGSAWVAPTQWLKDQPKTAAAFCDAMKEALDFIKNPANAETSAKALSTDTGVNAEVAALVIKDVYKDYSTDLPKDVLTKTFDAYVRLGVNKPEPKLEYDSLVQAPKG